MRRLLLLLAVAAPGAAAQVPAAPTAPAAGTARQGSSVEFRVGGIMISGDRSYDFLGNVESTTGSIRGIDFLFRGKAAGVSFRSMTGTFGDQPNVTSADARLLLFPPAFSIMLGAGRRALWSELNADSPTQFDLGIAGVSSTVRIGGSGLRTNISAAVYLPAGESKDRIKGGMEGEASVLWAVPKMPFFMQLGYRTELFTSQNSRFEVPEEVRGIRVGGGLQLGGR